MLVLKRLIRNLPLVKVKRKIASRKSANSRTRGISRDLVGQSLVGADNIDLCEVVVDKTRDVNAVQPRRWREQLGGGIWSFRTFV